VTVASAPASSANLGPGFDILALALDLRCRVTAMPREVWEITSGGSPVSSETENMVRRVAGGAGPHAIAIDSQIPQAGGLGSSAALLVAAAAAIVGDLDRDEVFAAAAAAEGHPDNVAAAVYGGLVVATPDGRVERLGTHESLHVLVAIPDERLSTSEARTLVPVEVPREVAVRTASRLAMLIEGLRTGEVRHLRAALGDEIHEAPRSVLTPTPGRLVANALDAGAVYAAWSGSGPSVIAFAVEDQLNSVFDSLEAVVGSTGSVIHPEIDREGVRLE